MKKITLDEAIDYFDEQCPNQFSKEDKTNLISELDELIFESVIKQRENPEISSFSAYNSDTDGARELLIPFMFKETYRFFLEKSIAYSNREITSYNNASKLFQAYFDNYFSWYNRTHKTKETAAISI
ncbi:MAG: hypothetical protein E7570_09405 [Ruminococcaceae bacterium]|nr:hypothetical protein [Oscillospiraceae bacterium]